MTIDPATVDANLDRVRHRIGDAGGDPDAITIVAVTKGFDADAPRAAIAAGLTVLGENYAQELANKAAQVSGAEWHFIGRLQSNKVKLVADAVTCWQSVDRSSLVGEIANRAPGARILVQVNATGEGHKGGCPITDVRSLVEEAGGAGLVVEGLMTVGVDGDDRATRAGFEAVADLCSDLDLHVTSMGMTDDLELAVRAGTTMLRVGSALFGPRPA
ncbi:MAG: YggS family pyridoxal phosphate-dependent enzyme [Acidimicrobiales bacterium]|nr:YggS family pyridoxal phosphate-dependent enzyme [Acidimicrobiales bacterium]